ncbi:MAG: glycosyl hydrolase, partial [Acidobacteria bacterium]|nr:glycosyl hydrolase [Acidobacteriota bacterium]
MPALAVAADAYLFTSFRRNGEAGVYFALSQDGYRWEAVKGNQAVVPPKFDGMLMRDPFLAQGPDRRWHLLWTTGWTRDAKAGRLTIGHAETSDLAAWGEQQMIEVMLPAARNAWAPEMVWDAAKKEWIIIWATTMEGKLPTAEGAPEKGYDHRIYAMRTADFRKFTAPELWFDPGYNCIDATVAKLSKRWVMVFKDERLKPEQKNLRLAWAPSAAG